MFLGVVGDDEEVEKDLAQRVALNKYFDFFNLLHVFSDELGDERLRLL